MRRLSSRGALFFLSSFVCLIAAQAEPRIITPENLSAFSFLGGDLKLSCYGTTGAVAALSKPWLQIGVRYRVLDVRREVKKRKAALRNAARGTAPRKKIKKLSARIRELRHAADTCLIKALVPATSAPVPGSSAASAIQQNIWTTVPSVIKNDGVEAFHLEVRGDLLLSSLPLCSPSTPQAPFVLWRLGSNLTGPGTPGGRVALHDDGLNGDRIAGDGVWTVGPYAWNTARAPSTFAMRAPGTYYEDVGYIQVFQIENGGCTDHGPFLAAVEVGVLTADAPTVTVRTLAPSAQGSAHLLNIQTDGSQALTVQKNLRNLGGDLSYLTKKAYEVLPQYEVADDSVDFFVLMSGEKLEQSYVADPFNYHPDNFVCGVYNPVFSDTGGIGLTPFNHRELYRNGGSARLQGAVFLDAGARGVNSSTLLHEINHRWGAYLKTRMGFLDNDFHYHSRSNVGSLLGGFKWQETSPGCLALNCDEGTNEATAASPLDKYLMGLIGPSQVPPIQVYGDASPPPLARCNQCINDIVKTVSINEIIFSHGARTPAVASSQKEFNLAFVVESTGRLLNATEMAFYDAIAAEVTKPISAPQAAGFNWVPITKFYGSNVTWRNALVTSPVIEFVYHQKEAGFSAGAYQNLAPNHGRLHVTGRNFGPAQGQGFVQFAASSGTITASNIISWSDEKIILAVPPEAISGNFLVQTHEGTRSAVHVLQIFPFGDVDSNRLVTVSDSSQVLTSSLGAPLSNLELVGGDVTGNGVLSATDAAQIFYKSQSPARCFAVEEGVSPAANADCFKKEQLTASGLTLHGAETTGERGSTVTVPIRLQNPDNKAVFGVDLEVAFDPQLLRNPRVMLTGRMANGYAAVSVVNGRFKIAVHGPAVVAASGELFSIAFDVSPVAMYWTSTPINILRADLNEQRAIAFDGHVHVTYPPPGVPYLLVCNEEDKIASTYMSAQDPEQLLFNFDDRLLTAEGPRAWARPVWGRLLTIAQEAVETDPVASCRIEEVDDASYHLLVCNPDENISSGAMHSIEGGELLFDSEDYLHDVNWGGIVAREIRQPSPEYDVAVRAIEADPFRRCTLAPK